MSHSPNADEITPEIEAILADLTELSCEAASPGGQLNVEVVDQLVKALSRNGWQRHGDVKHPLALEIKQRVKSQCKEPAIHRGAELDGIVGQIQKAYNSASRFDAASPEAQASHDRHATGPRTSLNSHPVNVNPLRR